MSSLSFKVKMVNGKNLALIATLLSVGISSPSCISVSQGQEPRKPQPTAEENLSRHQQDVETKIKDFSPNVWKEYKQGKLKAGFKVVKSDHLNATYNPNSKPPEMTFWCSPKYNKCLTSATEHELGHHLEKSLTTEAKKQLHDSLTQRFKQPDAKEFNKVLRLLTEQKQKAITVLQNAVTPLRTCERIQNNLRYLKYMDTQFRLSATARNMPQTLEHYKKRTDIELAPGVTVADRVVGYTFDPKLLEKYAAAEEAYRQTMPSCTQSNLEKGYKMLPGLQGKLKQLEKNSVAVYHGTEKFKKVDIPGFPIKAPSDSHTAKFEECHSAQKELGKAVLEFGKRFHPKTHSHRRKRYQKMRGFFALNQISSSFEYSGDAVSNLATVASLSRPDHDARGEEQFAAAIDSVVHGYSGPIQIAPLRFRVDPRTLSLMEQHIPDRSIQAKVREYQTKVHGRR